jgi:antibiotic biosynthesis monooxygenase (ABM) superfamily enzyme
VCVRACMHMSTSACLSACLCPVLMLHFGRCDGFSIVIWMLISTVLLVILNYVFMLCTKLIYSSSYNQNSSVAA